MVSFLGDSVVNDPRFAQFVTPEMKEGFAKIRNLLDEGLGRLRSDRHSLALLITGLPSESDETYAFLEKYIQLCDSALPHGYYSVGESVMLAEMKAGFQHEMTVVTLLTVAAILLIVLLAFRSVLVALLLVATVMTGVFVNVSVSAIGGGSLLYLAYLIVQSILMGAAIDYGILFANYYREKRRTLDIGASLQEAYRGSINTILTSGLILILVPGAMAVLVTDPTIASIVRAISIGALATVLLVLLVLPGMLAACDRLTRRKK
jgi:predicted RND superfamily exporter protein